MALLQEVVDLLDDCSEEEEAALPAVEVPSLEEKNLVEKQQKALSNDAIDLCESSDEEDAKKPSALANPSAAANIKRSKATNYESSSDEDDDILLAGAGTSIFSRKSQAATPTSHREISRAQASGERQSLANVSYYASNDKEVASVRRASLSQEDNLDDDEILNYSSGLVIQRSVHNRKAPPARQAHGMDSDDDDGDDLLTYSSGLTRSASSVPRQTTPSTSKNVVTNPYGKKSAPRHSPPLVPTQQPFPYPKLTDGAKQYPDERARYLLAFWKYGKKHCTRKSFQRPKLDAIAKRVVRLALSEFPLRSLEEYVSTGAASVSANRQQRNEIRDELDQGGFDQIVTPVEVASRNRKYYSIAEACLVTLLREAELRLADGENVQSHLSETLSWVALTGLIPAIDRSLSPECPGRLTRQSDEDSGAEHYLQQSTRSMEFLQVSKLECNLGKEGGPFIKRHNVKGKVHYELLPAGYEAALRIRSRQFPALPGHYRSSKTNTVNQVDERYPDICLGVDLREGGGGAKTLHQMCNKLEMMHCPYFVGSLSIGDYVFFTSKDGTQSSNNTMDLLCPICVERKSIQDVAQSIYDGRWTAQKRRMYVAQYVFGYGNCHMVFIIEGNESKQTVSGDYVGARWYDVDKKRLNEEIDNLKAEGFDVLRTTSVENSMFQLARWAQRIATEMKAGTMKAQYTYTEFKKKVAEIPRQTDFSRLAKYHMQQRLEREAASQAAAKDSDVEVLSETGNHAARRSSAKESALSSSKPPSKKQKTARNTDDDEFFGWTKTALQGECAAAGLSQGGSRADLLKRLKGPRPPKLWLERKAKKQYVPERCNVAGTAILVALYLHEKEAGPGDVGMTKDELYVKAEGLEITKNPFSGGTIQTGPYHYDGWASMSKLLSGDPALVILKNKRYKLTRSCDIAGYKVAEAMHTWCHQHNNCPCGGVRL